MNAAVASVFSELDIFLLPHINKVFFFYSQLALARRHLPWGDDVHQMMAIAPAGALCCYQVAHQ